MTTVEELRESLCSFVLSHIRWGGIEAIMAPDPKVPVAYAVDSLIAAAREEGAEQEREKILGEAEEAKAEIGHVVVWTEFEGPVFIIPASVLAPATKDGGK